MDFEAIIGGLVVGSRELDRMEAEINVVVRMVRAFLTQDDLIHKLQIRQGCVTPLTQDFRDMSTGITWRIGVAEGGGTFILCDRGGSDVLFYVDAGMKRGNVAHQDIRRVRRSLPALLSGLQMHTPDIFSRWQPFFDAAEAAK
jgi:hypothetical protein